MDLKEYQVALRTEDGRKMIEAVRSLKISHTDYLLGLVAEQQRREVANAELTERLRLQEIEDKLAADEKEEGLEFLAKHNYKLDVHALNRRQPGEFECREFIESVLGTMPHHWDRREDTMLKLAHFRRHKRKAVKRTPGKNSNYPSHKPEENHPPGKDDSKKISNLIGKAANFANSAKTKKASPYVLTITNYTQLWWVPNVVVAHEKEGIEVLHLASGRTLCKLHLQEGGLHADVNGDGVLDHVQVLNWAYKG
ncbi:uncharacterized protein [Rutidosis leptorrhynchoides]|uniref:uncharacterized protein n=1 Tax=Rutidosis leptorrhynchoides TaxID=125765 RepID=UPI003A99AC20